MRSVQQCAIFAQAQAMRGAAPLQAADPWRCLYELVPVFADEHSKAVRKETLLTVQPRAEMIEGTPNRSVTTVIDTRTVTGTGLFEGTHVEPSQKTTSVQAREPVHTVVDEQGNTLAACAVCAQLAQVLPSQALYSRSMRPISATEDEMFKRTVRGFQHPPARPMRQRAEIITPHWRHAAAATHVGIRDEREKCKEGHKEQKMEATAASWENEDRKVTEAAVNPLLYLQFKSFLPGKPNRRFCDWFARAENTTELIYCSVQDDAFGYAWKHNPQLMSYVFPPPVLAKRACIKFLHERAQGILIIPDIDRAWVRKAKESARQTFVIPCTDEEAALVLPLQGGRPVGCLQHDYLALLIADEKEMPTVTHVLNGAPGPMRLYLHPQWRKAMQQPDVFLRPQVWRRVLACHKDVVWAEALCHTLQKGAAMEYEGPRNTSMIGPNLPSFTEHTGKLIEARDKSLQNHFSMGMFKVTAGTAASPVCNPWLIPVGAVPKKGTAPLQVRPIKHFSYPEGRSINDATPQYYFTTETIRHIVQTVRETGAHTLAYLWDCKNAYHLIRLQSEDRHLCGERWPHGMQAYNSVFPFGLTAAGFMWEQMRRAIAHMHTHYLPVPQHHVRSHVDDFSHFYPPVRNSKGEVVPNWAGAIMLTICTRLLNAAAGVPDPVAKAEGPTFQAKVLGLYIDLRTWTLSIPQDKYEATMRAIERMATASTTTVEAIRSLVGKLTFLTVVFPEGRAFLQRLRTLQSAFDDKAPHTTVNLQNIGQSEEQQFRKDLHWWVKALPAWQGISLAWDDPWLVAELILHAWTDACERGMGFYHDGMFAFREWERHELNLARRAQRVSMPYLEMRALTIAVVTFAARWRNKRVLIHTDNMTNVLIFQSGSAKHPAMQRLMRIVAHTTLAYNIHLRVEHIATEQNVLADPLSRIELDRFYDAYALQHPSQPRARPQKVHPSSIDTLNF